MLCAFDKNDKNDKKMIKMMKDRYYTFLICDNLLLLSS